MPGKKTDKSMQQERSLLRLLDDDILNTKQIVKQTGWKYPVVTRHVNNLMDNGQLFKRKHNNNNYYCVDNNKLQSMPTRLDRICNLLNDSGDMRIDDVVSRLKIYSKTSIFNVIASQSKDNVRVYSYYVEGEQYQMLTTKKPTKEMLAVKKSNTLKEDKHIKKDKQVSTHDVDNRVPLPKNIKPPVKRQPVKPTRGHTKFKKYNDDSIKVHSQMVETISSLIVLFQTSEDPYLYMHKLRHRIETMPEAYWCEQVSLDSYVEDIDMVELPKTGANKDIDRSP